MNRPKYPEQFYIIKVPVRDSDFQIGLRQGHGFANVSQKSALQFPKTTTPKWPDFDFPKTNRGGNESNTVRVHAEFSGGSPQLAPLPRTWDYLNEIPDWVKSIAPARTQTTQTDVIVPLAQAGITGIIFVSIPVALILGYLSWRLPLSINAVDISFISLFFGIAVSGLQWRKLLRENRKLLWFIESVTGIDLDGDGEIGSAEFMPRKIPVNNGSKTQDLEMFDKSGLSVNEWKQVAIALLHNKSNLSKWGIYNNCDLSQARSNFAAQQLKGRGYGNEKGINKSGYNFLFPYLPDEFPSRLPCPTE